MEGSLSVAIIAVPACQVLIVGEIITPQLLGMCVQTVVSRNDNYMAEVNKG